MPRAGEHERRRDSLVRLSHTRYHVSRNVEVTPISLLTLEQTVLLLNANSILQHSIESKQNMSKRETKNKTTMTFS